MTRKQHVEKRLESLKFLLEEELKSDDASLNYIDDLKLSIADCEHQIKYFEQYPEGIEFLSA